MRTTASPISRCREPFSLSRADSPTRHPAERIARRGVPNGQRIGLKTQFGQQHGGLQRADAMPLHAMGIGQNLTGRPLEDDTPFVHQQDPVRGQDVLGLVLDQDDPLHFIPEDLRELEDVSLAHGVQVGRRFVHYDQHGPAREYRRNG